MDESSSDDFFPDHAREPLLNHPNVGTGSAKAGKFLALFGVPFALAGVFALALATGVLKASGGDAPPIVIGSMGGVFGISGLGMIAIGLRSWLRERQLNASLGRYLEEPWRFDGWDEHFAPDQLAGFLQAFGAVAFLVLFLLPFNYALFWRGTNEPLIPKLMVGLFDLIAVGALGFACYRVGRRLKYGDGKLRYAELPLLLPRIGLTLRLPRALQGRFSELRCELRCCEQLWEQSGDGKSLQTYSLYREARTFSPSEAHQELRLEYELPTTAPGTELHGEVVRFYELEVQAETPGIDYRALYLVPIYR